MDWELVFYIIAAIVFIITSAFRGKKKHDQEGELMEQQQREENEYFEQMLQQDKDGESGVYQEEEQEHNFEDAQEPMESELQQEVTTAKDYISSAAHDKEQDETSKEEITGEEIDTVKRDLAEKKATILDLRKAVIYQTILNRKYQ